jgi:hypothetical protein
VPVGIAPYLPGRATVTFTDGVTDLVDVVWQEVPPGALDRPGVFTLHGALAEHGRTTSLAVTVSDAYTPGRNLAGTATPSASFSGTPQTVPAALNNGVQPEATGWSNRYVKAQTALLPSYSLAQPAGWVSLTWAAPQPVGSLVAYFRLDTGRAVPAAVSVEYWDGRRFVPAADQSVSMATGSEEPTTITFANVSTNAVRLVITSPAPGTSNGFVQISELRAIGAEPAG